MRYAGSSAFIFSAASVTLRAQARQCERIADTRLPGRNRQKQLCVLAASAAMAEPALEREAQEWIEAVAMSPFRHSTFAESLKDGVILCK